jgi:hypothetical protein
MALLSAAPASPLARKVTLMLLACSKAASTDSLMANESCVITVSGTGSPEESGATVCMGASVTMFASRAEGCVAIACGAQAESRRQKAESRKMCFIDSPVIGN